VPTLGDLLKQQSPQSLNVAVAGKDRAAVMMGGRNVDQRWYWDGKKFSTDRTGAAIPATVRKANAALAVSLASPREPLEVPPFCQPKATPVTVAPTLTVGNGRFARAAGDLRAFRASPEIDGTILAIAAGLIQELKLGRDPSPDILSVGLSATDYVGHSFGPGGGEMCLQLLTLDRELGDFFRVLDADRLDYAVVLTADHGGLDIPERLHARIPQATRADPALATTLVGKAIGAKLKLSGPVLLGDLANDVFIDRNLRPADRTRVEQEAVAFFKAHPQVEAIFTARQLSRVPVPSGPPNNWTIPQRVRASFDQHRSGDLYVVLKKYVMPIVSPSAGYVSTHGSVWDYDRRVPVLFWRKGMTPVRSNGVADTVDIMPTLAAELGISLAPRSVDGTCLSVPGIACPAR
jgi:predicted AlkP superfamily pyrophosphatase or phosphodiesterase